MPREKQQTLRAFVTKCRRCGEPVFYWESTRGAKVFFQYPIYGKLVRHRCPRRRPEQGPEKSHAERRWEEHHKEYYECPACGKSFPREQQLKQHIKQKKHVDRVHRDFFSGGQYFRAMEQFLEAEGDPAGPGGEMPPAPASTPAAVPTPASSPAPATTPAPAPAPASAPAPGGTSQDPRDPADFKKTYKDYSREVRWGRITLKQRKPKRTKPPEDDAGNAGDE